MASLRSTSFWFVVFLIFCSSHCFARKVITNDLQPKDNDELGRQLASKTSERSIKGDGLITSKVSASGFGSGSGFGDGSIGDPCQPSCTPVSNPGQGNCHDTPYAPGSPACGAEPQNPVSGPNYPPQCGGPFSGWGDTPSCAPQPTNPPPVCAPQPTYQPPACVPEPTNLPPSCSPQPTHPPNCAPQPTNPPDCSTQPANPPVVCSPQPSTPPIICAPQPCNPGDDQRSRMHGHGVNPSQINQSGKEAQVKPLGKEKQDGKPAQGKEAQVKPLEKEKQDKESARDKQDNEPAHENQDNEPMPPGSLNLLQEQTAEAPMFNYMNDDDDDSELEM